MIPVVQSPFSNNSANNIIAVHASGEPRKVQDLVVFSKEAVSSQQLSECQGALHAARYFPLIQQPLAESGRLLYPYFEGISEAEAQLNYAKTGDSYWLEMVMDVEMRKAGDILNAYRWSFRPALASGNAAVDWEIHRFFHHRLRDVTRLRQFYDAGLHVAGRSVSLNELMMLPISINGYDHPCLFEIHSRAESLLDPARFANQPVAFGLGDAHGGNIMIEEKPQKNAARRVLHIDDEASGYHSPILDLAKPFYNDIFFGALYADCVTDAPKVEAGIEDGILKLKYIGVERTLSKAVLEITRRYLIEPLLLHAPETSVDVKAGIETLASALFACAVLTRNFDERSDAFLVNLCHGVLLSQVKTLDELWTTAQHLLSAC